MVDGLAYYPNFITAAEEAALIQTIDAQIWQSPFKRRVQHYGYVYDYKKRTVTQEMYLGVLPVWLEALAQRFVDEGLIAEKPDQAIINEYQAGQGIALHVDCEPCFGDTIVSLSLGSVCVMDFRRLVDKHVERQILARESVVVMHGEARYQWQHGIAARKTDMIHGKRQARQRRISVTFRKVVLHSK